MTVLLEDLDIPFSSYYYAIAHPLEEREKRFREKYKDIETKIRKVLREHPAYGYRRIKKELGNQGIIVNHKPLKTLLKSNSFLRSLRKIREPRPSLIVKTIRELGEKVNLLQRVKFPKPLQILITDFTRICFTFGCLKLILYVDLVSKIIVGWALSEKENTKTALKSWQRAKISLRKMKVNLNNLIVHRDQGSPFTSYEYVGKLTRDGIALSYSENGFKENQEMESINGHFKDEYAFLLSEVRNLKEAEKIIERCVQDWNKRRLYSSLGYQTPNQFLHTYLEKKENSKIG